VAKLAADSPITLAALTAPPVSLEGAVGDASRTWRSTARRSRSVTSSMQPHRFYPPLVRRMPPFQEIGSHFAGTGRKKFVWDRARGMGLAALTERCIVPLKGGLGAAGGGGGALALPKTARYARVRWSGLRYMSMSQRLLIVGVGD
jgi:hypothetical protein